MTPAPYETTAATVANEYAKDHGINVPVPGHRPARRWRGSRASASLCMRDSSSSSGSPMPNGKRPIPRVETDRIVQNSEDSAEPMPASLSTGQGQRQHQHQRLPDEPHTHCTSDKLPTNC